MSSSIHCHVHLNTFLKISIQVCTALFWYVICKERERLYSMEMEVADDKIWGFIFTVTQFTGNRNTWPFTLEVVRTSKTLTVLRMVW